LKIGEKTDVFRKILGISLLALLLFFLPLGAPVWAQQLSVPMDPKAVLPADDLTSPDDGRTLSREQASRLREQGQDLSKLDPSESVFWSRTAPTSPCQDSVCEAASVATKENPLAIQYFEGRSSPRGLYRALGDVGDTRVMFVLTQDLNRALLRAHLMAKVGFQLPGLALAKYARIRFPDEAKKKIY
jgi:hypothetical protein